MDVHTANKRALFPRLRTFDRGVLATDATFHCYHPLNDLVGREAIECGFLGPLLRAFPDIERRDDFLLAGAFQGRNWVASAGHYCGTFSGPFLRIPPTGGVAWLRFVEVFAVADGRITVGYVHLDLVDLMRQAGVSPFAQSLGADPLVPGPRNHDAILLDPQDPAAGEASLALMQAMGQGLGSYDGRSLDSMGMERFWSEQMLWYGPCGIGTNRGIKGFQQFHQAPFLHAFPDRVGGNHQARFGDGVYVLSSGWPSVRATFAGHWLGQAPTGAPITMRVTDIWRREGDRLVENWVLIDIPDVMRQAGRDLFAHLPG